MAEYEDQCAMAMNFPIRFAARQTRKNLTAFAGALAAAN
jgi:hypothetical protein